MPIIITGYRSNYRSNSKTVYDVWFESLSIPAEITPAELLEIHEWTTRHLQELKQEVATAQDEASRPDDRPVP